MVKAGEWKKKSQTVWESKRDRIQNKTLNRTELKKNVAKRAIGMWNGER